jgi:hypothetical protein
MNSCRACCFAVIFIAVLYCQVHAQSPAFSEEWQISLSNAAFVKLEQPPLEIPETEDWLGELLRPAENERTGWNKLMYLAAACFGFAAFDYVGYNLCRESTWALPAYRVIQGLTQIGITYYLYKKVSAGTALGFTLVWWTFGTDFLYYGYAEVINPGHPWESRGDFNNSVMGNQTTWAYWTPLGISRGMKRDKPIAGDALIAQALLGAALGVTFTVNF